MYNFENKDLKKWWEVLNGQTVDFSDFENGDIKEIVTLQSSI